MPMLAHGPNGNLRALQDTHPHPLLSFGDVADGSGRPCSRAWSIQQTDGGEGRERLSTGERLTTPVGAIHRRGDMSPDAPFVTLNGSVTR